jgi:prepilin-type processing-associated H-X9-DG protein
VFVCPSGNETPAQNWSSLETGGHLSYIYVGGNLTSSMAPGTVVLYENPAEHGGSGMNTLFGDGHVEFFGMVETQKILQQLKTGHNPPTLTTGP